MRKLYSFLFILLGLTTATPSYAQLEELEGKSITIGDWSENVIPDNQWYLVYNRYSGGYMWDRGARRAIYTTNGTSVVYDGMLATNAADYLVRFLSVEPDEGDAHDKYYFQFGTGNYVYWPSAADYTIYTYASIDNANPAYVYQILDTPYHLGITTADGSNFSVCSWGSGTYIALSSSAGEVDNLDGDCDWAIYPVTLEEVSEFEKAVLELQNTYLAYLDYYDYFPAGNTYGHYGEEAVAAFQEALNIAATAIDNPETLEGSTIEEVSMLAQNIIDAYNAVLESYIPLAMDIDDGYYFFTSIVNFYETDEGGEEIFLTKGMYSEEESAGNIYAKWKTIDNSCPFLWKVTAMGDKVYEIVNMATDATFDKVAMSEYVTMSVDNGNLMVFDTGVGEYADQGLVTIRVSSQDEGGYYYLHCDGHGNGAGKSGNIVGWINTAGPSTWRLVPVDDETAQGIIDEYASTKNSMQRYELAQEMIEDAKTKMAIAEDVFVSSTELITSVDQLSSPYTDPTEGSLENLLDGNLTTFWHSTWQGGEVPAGTHYLQVELTDPVDQLVFKFSRRAGAMNDHITQWGVFGAPSFDADKSDCIFLDEIYTPFTTNTETLTSSAFKTEGFTTLRFYIDDTTGTGDGCRGYGHMSEFQLYEFFEKETSQKKAMGDVYTNLENMIEVAETEDQEITEETYNALKEAYEAFIAVFVDPTELRATLDEASVATVGMVFGNDPGYWTDSSSADALAETITEATEYDDSGVYTQERTDSYVATLIEQMAAITDAVVKVRTDKWYRIRYATETEIEENGWSLEVGEASETSESLYGKYLTVANLIEEGDSYIIEAMGERDLDDIVVQQSVSFFSEVEAGPGLYFDDEQDILYDDYAKFRFVNVGDTAYMMQNKATGLFLKSAGISGPVTLSVHPSLFTISPVGFGENVFASWFVDGTKQDYLNAQRDYNALVTWSYSEPGSNGGLFIEDINEDVASDYDGTSFNMSIQLGAINTFCYPVSITANEGAIYTATVDGNTVTLSQMANNTAGAGQPFVYVNGSLDEYDSEMEADIISFTHGYHVESEPQTLGDLVGSYYLIFVADGNLVASANGFEVSSTFISANSAYVEGAFDSDDVIEIFISDETYDSVGATLSKVGQKGNIYSIDGKLVGKGNINSLKTLGKGIYIVGGVKVAVK